ncbi:NADH-quinone oxidoreductase subunit M [Candidatus Tachikawaea gelatinosa]|uniref:NADH-quinone oxidoreductase subunit M n=1 Tax=Candidatus Tachikawaea gelatinosa TaxID=1410383 RepID=A0A090AL53_9ENTR|nr:NADH-quinone oxidoreductase subunit M [Candidatus Tachikawaea gelatinosa]BAP58324.1 NADH-quinone oxidoreductase subunit M [Candidatus Tachikawaea gelatinosa]
MLLPFLIVIPFIGGLLCCLTEKLNIKIPRWIALITTGTFLISVLYIWSTCKNNINFYSKFPFWKIEFLYPWIQRFHINFHFALDGLSLTMLVLTSLLGFMAVLCSWNEIQKYQGLFYLNLMWILVGVIGVFIAVDLFLFFFFWEIMLVPMYFLIALWGHKASNGKTRISAATKFFIYTQLSGLVMLVAILGLVAIHYYTTGILTFNYEDLLHTKMPYYVEYLLMIGFFVAFAIKMPIIPLHGWLPDAHSQAPTAGSVDLAGILLKTAAYGLLRFNLCLFPHASIDFTPIALFLGLLGIFYGAFLAFSQNDVKRLIAYTSISHMGFTLIGIYSFNQLALHGVIVQMFAHGISSAALFILCGQLYERTKTRNIHEMGGLWSSIKWIPSLSLFFSMANIGIPGTGNFVGEFMILIGSFKIIPWVVVISIFGLVFASVYSLHMMQRIYFGLLPAILSKSVTHFKQTELREYFIIITLTLTSVIIGIYPQLLLNVSYESINDLYKWIMI